jgi:hypothetical protein
MSIVVVVTDSIRLCIKDKMHLYTLVGCSRHCKDLMHGLHVVFFACMYHHKLYHPVTFLNWRFQIKL